MKSAWRYALVVAAVMAASLLLAACGGGQEEEAAAPTVTTEAAETAETAETAQPALTRTAAPAASPTVEELACSDPQPPFVTDFEVRQTPSLDEPQARVPFRDPVFGSCLVRVTDRKADLSPDDPSAGLKNEYSRVQSFNADGSRVLVRGIEATWYLYDAHTLQPLAELPLQNEPRWDASDPDLVYFTVPDEIQLMSYNVQTAKQTLIHDFADDVPGQAVVFVWTRYEGSPSLDGRYWGLIANDEEGAALAFLVYDRQVDQVIAKRDMRGVRVEAGIDSVTISPLGNYLLAYFDDPCQPGQLGDDAHPCGLMVYDRELKSGRGLLRTVGHSDPALDAEGREVLVYQDIDTDNISVLDLASGTVTPLWPIDFSHTGDWPPLLGACLPEAGLGAGLHLHRWLPDRLHLDGQLGLCHRAEAERAGGAVGAHSLGGGRNPRAGLLGGAARQCEPGLHAGRLHEQLGPLWHRRGGDVHDRVAAGLARAVALI